MSWVTLPHEENSDKYNLSRAALEAEFAWLNVEVERLTVARAEMSLSLAGALRRIRELEQMLETERTTDDTDNGYEAGQESEI